MSWRRIRPVALGVIRRGEEILVSELHDPTEGETFYRPPGGGIEFGERGDEALAREFDEELDADLADVTRIGTLENRFSFDGTRGHEIVLVYEASFADDARYEAESIRGREDDGTTYEATWRRPDSFDADEPLYPDDLAGLL